MTVLSNITVYLVAWAVLGQGSETMVGPQDQQKFRCTSMCVECTE